MATGAQCGLVTTKLALKSFTLYSKLEHLEEIIVGATNYRATPQHTVVNLKGFAKEVWRHVSTFSVSLLKA